MWVEGENHYVGEIPAFESGTTVYFKVRVHSDAGIFESQIGFYTVQSDERDLLILVIALSATGLIVVVIGRIFVRRRK